ncbi:hypothetical protein ARZXY2_961 [Arthrobacter sp. ZXY-2]|nr:hypothetical protein ARZXY2_961 [Arthrobacter sp. ZXY-2]
MHFPELGSPSWGCPFVLTYLNYGPVDWNNFGRLLGAY